jgi:uncharacterized membrane protein
MIDYVHETKQSNMSKDTRWKIKNYAVEGKKNVMNRADAIQDTRAQLDYQIRDILDNFYTIGLRNKHQEE